MVLASFGKRIDIGAYYPLLSIYQDVFQDEFRSFSILAEAGSWLQVSRRANDYSPLRRILILFIAFNPVNRVQNGKDANFLVVFGVTAPNEIFEGNQDGPV